jgi:hypothetical protein
VEQPEMDKKRNFKTLIAEHSRNGYQWVNAWARKCSSSTANTFQNPSRIVRFDVFIQIIYNTSMNDLGNRTQESMSGQFGHPQSNKAKEHLSGQWWCMWNIACPMFVICCCRISKSRPVFAPELLYWVFEQKRAELFS